MKYSSDRRKCMRPGPQTGNGYLNFLREFRKKNCGFRTAIEMVRAGAKAWQSLSAQEKMRYRNMKSSKRLRKSKRCMRPGPITNNGYLNFLRKYRQTCCGMSARETIRRGAMAWNRLTPQEKSKYNRTGRKSKRSQRSRRRGIC